MDMARVSVQDHGGLHCWLRQQPASSAAATVQSGSLESGKQYPDDERTSFYEQSTDPIEREYGTSGEIWFYF